MAIEGNWTIVRISSRKSMRLPYNGPRRLGGHPFIIYIRVNENNSFVARSRYSFFNPWQQKTLIGGWIHKLNLMGTLIQKSSAEMFMFGPINDFDNEKTLKTTEALPSEQESKSLIHCWWRVWDMFHGYVDKILKVNGITYPNQHFIECMRDNGARKRTWYFPLSHNGLS